MKSIYLIVSLYLIGTNICIAQNILQEDFEGNFPPPGWTIYNNGIGANWTQNTYNFSFNGSYSMELYSTSNTTDAWAFTPSLTLNTNPVYISFWVRVSNSYFPESLTLTIGNGNVMANQTTLLLDSANITNTTYRRWSAVFLPPSTGNYNFAFNCNNSSTGSLFVDSITISQLQPNCTGMQQGGITVAEDSTICQNTSFNLTVSGGSSGVSGLTYQWLSSLDSINWNNVIGETNIGYSVPYSTISTPTYFKRKIICNSTDTVSVPIRIGIKPNYLCLCNPTYTPSSGNTCPYIDSINIIGTTLNSGPLNLPNNAYQFNAVPTYLTAGGIYLMYIHFNTIATSGIWFDWNQDGVFDPTEWSLISSAKTDDTLLFVVPQNSILGNTLMRIRVGNPGSPISSANSACLLYPCGETLDYVINVQRNTLPINTIQLKGEIVGNKNIVSWSKLFDSNDKGFDILRSNNGLTFEKIGFVSNTNSNENTTYHFEDKQPLTGSNYYQLKLLNNNGQIMYSNLFELINDNTKFIISPNPAKDYVTISGGNVKEVRISDARGRVLLVIRDKRVDFRGLVNGVYYVEIETLNGNHVTQKLIKLPY